MRLPGRNEVFVAFLRHFGDLHLLMPHCFHVAGEARPAFAALLLRQASSGFHGAAFMRNQVRARPAIVLSLRQHGPAQGGELARDSHSGDLVASPRPDADEEGA